MSKIEIRQFILAALAEQKIDIAIARRRNDSGMIMAATAQYQMLQTALIGSSKYANNFLHRA